LEDDILLPDTSRSFATSVIAEDRTGCTRYAQVPVINVGLLVLSSLRLRHKSYIALKKLDSFGTYTFDHSGAPYQRKTGALFSYQWGALFFPQKVDDLF